MAVYWLHRKEWEKGTLQKKPKGRKQKRQDTDKDEGFPGGGRKGMSSRLATVVQRKDGGGVPRKTQWWKEFITDTDPTGRRAQ